MFKKILFAVLLGFLCGGSASAQEPAAYDPKLAGSAVYSDPGFQDFIETSYGYMNPRHNAPLTRSLRDAVAAAVSAPAAAPRKAAAADNKTSERSSAGAQKKARHGRSPRTAAGARGGRSLRAGAHAGAYAGRVTRAGSLFVSTAARSRP